VDNITSNRSDDLRNFVVNSKRFGIKRKFGNRERTNSKFSSEVFEFNQSEESTSPSRNCEESDETVPYNHIKERKTPCIGSSENWGHEYVDLSDNDTEPMDTCEVDTEGHKQCYICKSNEMMLPDGSVRKWTRKGNSKLLLQRGKVYFKIYIWFFKLQQ